MPELASIALMILLLAIITPFITMCWLLAILDRYSINMLFAINRIINIIQQVTIFELLTFSFIFSEYFQNIPPA